MRGSPKMKTKNPMLSQAPLNAIDDGGGGDDDDGGGDDDDDE